MSTPGASCDLLVIPSELARLEEVRLWVGERASGLGYGSKALADLEVAVTEAISNVIRHSYDNDENQEIQLSMQFEHDKLTITVTDFGKPFDRSAQAPVDLETPHAGGYGLYLIEETMDEVEWDTVPPDKNRLRMSKHLGGEAGG